MNKYSDFKIFGFPDKINSLREDRITAPIHVRIKPTNICMHKCPFCPYQRKERENISLRDSIPLNEMENIISGLYEMGTKAITITGGGEPLIYPHIKEMFNLVLFYDFDFGVNTNGQKILNYLEYLQFSNWVRVSADYWDKESFTASRGVSEIFYGKILKGIQELSSTKCDVGINFIVTQENHRHLYDAASIFMDVGAKSIRFAPVMVKNYAEYHSPINSVVIDSINNIIGDPKFTDIEIYSSYNENINTRRPYTRCFSQEITPVIGSDLNVYRCHFTAYEPHGLIGNIKDAISFQNLWSFARTRDNILQYRPDIHCKHFCPNDGKNILLNNIVSTNNDNFV